MHAKFIAAITAASIAISSLTAAPAFAGNKRNDDGMAQLIVGLIALGALAATIDKKKHQTHQNTQPRVDYDQPRRPRHDRPRSQRPQVNDRKALPARCKRTFETRKGPRRVFGKGCLRRHYDWAHRLPQRCEIRVRTDRGHRKGYKARCLRKHGYTVAWK